MKIVQTAKLCTVRLSVYKERSVSVVIFYSYLLYSL